MEEAIMQVIMELIMEVIMEVTIEVTMETTVVEIVERAETELHLKFTDLVGMVTTHHWKPVLSLIPTYLDLTMTMKPRTDLQDTTLIRWDNMRGMESWGSMREREVWENTMEAGKDSIMGSLTLKPVH